MREATRSPSAHIPTSSACSMTCKSPLTFPSLLGRGYGERSCFACNKPLGPGDLFPGVDLVSPTSPDGINLGITSAGDNVLTGNGGISGQWLTKNANVFTLGGYTGEPSANIGRVRFQYGTALTEFSIAVVPEPGSITLCLAGMALGAIGGGVGMYGNFALRPFQSHAAFFAWSRVR